MIKLRDTKNNENDENIISKNRCTPGYEISSESNRYLKIVFFPIDLASLDANRIITASAGLENVFQRRKDSFLFDLACMTKLANSDIFCNYVQDYHNITDIGDSIVGASTFYIGEKLSRNQSLNDILLNIAAICDAMSKISTCNNTADVSLDDILCELASPGAIHILYICFSGRKSWLGRRLAEVLLEKIKGESLFPCDFTLSEWIVKNYSMHPLARLSVLRLLKMLLRIDESLNWRSAVQEALAIKTIIDNCTSYFLNLVNPIPLHYCPCVESINKAFENTNVVVLYSDDDTAEMAALAYAGYNQQYTHIAHTDISGGVRSAIISERFSLSSGENSFEERLRVIEVMCSEPTLLIFNGFTDMKDEEFACLTYLPAHIILIAKEDMSDYGLVSFNIREENE